jgi:hypothetical protein
MLYRVAFAIVLVAFVAAPAVAQDIEGQYITSAGVVDTTQLPDGQLLVSNQYPMFGLSENAEGLFDNVKSQCSSWSLSEAEMDAPSALAGSCYGLDAEGDVYWFWWRAEEMGTDACPILCGTWSVYRGTGKYEGMGGKGMWRVVTQFQDGSNRGVFTYKGM